MLKYFLLLFVFICACTPDISRVRQVAPATLSKLLGEPVSILHAKSDFNEGNGDPSRVLIWIRAVNDTELMMMISANFSDDTLRCKEKLVKSKFAEKKQNLKLTRAFIAQADKRLSPYAAYVAQDLETGKTDIRLLMYTPPCHGDSCTLYTNILDTVRAFQKGSGNPLELTVSFYAKNRHRSNLGKIVQRGLAPNYKRKYDTRNAEFIIRDIEIKKDTTPSSLRQQVALSGSGNIRYQRSQTVREALVEYLNKKESKKYHVQPGGSGLKLVYPSLTRVTHTAVVCQKSHVKKSKRCKEKFAREVTCEFDFSNKKIKLLPNPPAPTAP